MASKKDRERTRTPESPGAESPGAGERSRFPIVGLGASAGGVGALEKLFAHVPARSGLAFVVVTHQHPGQPSLMPEILSRKTDMPVMQVAEPTRVTPDHVYTALPGHDLAIIDGVLHAIPVDSRRLPHLPVDYFLRSLAQDQKEQAIAIILSGTGSDGTLGIKEIKAELGMVMVQEEASAEYSGMPHSAIATQLVDFVLPAAEMPRQLVAYAKALRAGGAAVVARAEPALEALQRVFLLIRNRSGHDFSHYKRSTVTRRIERRMHVHRIDDVDQYVRYLQQNTAEVDLLFKELLIGVTSFFRDREAWDALGHVLTELLAGKSDEYVVRAWVAGCSTGEEAYALGIALRECMDEIGRTLSVQIFATDLDADAVDVARTGAYPLGIANDVSGKRLARFFTHEGEAYRVKKEIREMIVFAPQNVITDPPFTKLDLVSCRNLLIYLDSTLQEKLLPLFHYALKDDGILFLGPSESAGPGSELFSAVDKKWKIFRRKEVPPGSYVAEFPLQARARQVPARGPAMRVGWGANLEQVAERALLKELVPPTVLVNERGDVVHVHGRTGMFLEPAQGPQSSANLFNMVREGLEMGLAMAMRQAAVSNDEIVQRGIRVKTNGDHTYVNLRVQRLQAPEALRGLLRIIFEEAPPAPRETPTAETAPAPPDRGAALEQELQYVKESHQATVEELETSNEELKSTNEELQSTNEELQSANEELGTSREEMQSLNEELQTVNAELQNKLEQLARANDDMKNLLDSTDIATVFVDRELVIQRYTERAREIFRLIPSDVGRPLGDLASTLHYDALLGDAREVLRTLAARQSEVRAAGGGRYLMRILPYRTTENVIDGLVLTFVDVTNVERLREEQTRLHEVLDRSPIALFGQDEQLRISWVVRSLLGRAEDDVIGKSDHDLFEGQDAERLVEAKRAVLQTGVPTRQRAHAKVDGVRKEYELLVAPERDASGRITGISCVAIDVGAPVEEAG